MKVIQETGYYIYKQLIITYENCTRPRTFLNDFSRSLIFISNCLCIYMIFFSKSVKVGVVRAVHIHGVFLFILFFIDTYPFFQFILIFLISINFFRLAYMCLGLARAKTESWWDKNQWYHMERSKLCGCAGQHPNFFFFIFQPARSLIYLTLVDRC